jgi:hypothetical protein
MQIHIVIHPAPVRSSDVLRRLWRVSRQMACRLLGHRNAVAVGSGTVALRCDRCGWRSPGWMLDSRRAGSSHSDTPADAPTAARAAGHLRMVKSPTR